jgi:hypothetical protein
MHGIRGQLTPMLDPPSVQVGSRPGSRDGHWTEAAVSGPPEPVEGSGGPLIRS